MQEMACSITCAQNEDIPAMLRLEQKYFSPYWQTDSNSVDKLIKKDPMMLRVCKTGRELKGFYWVIPLEYDIWKKVITGKIGEKDLKGHIRSFEDPDIYLYISSVVVNIEDKRHKAFTEALVHDFAKHFVLRADDKAPDIKAIGAITISRGGAHLMHQYKFHYNGSFTANGKPVGSYAIKRNRLVELVLKSQPKKAGKNPVVEV